MPSYEYWWEDPQKVLLGGRLRRPRLQALQSGKRWRCEVTYYPKAGSKGERRLSSTHHSRREAAIAMESFLETFNTPKRLPAGTAKASIPPRLSLRETATGRRKKTDVRAAATSAVYTTKPTAPDLVAYERVRRELRWPRLTMLHWQTHKELKHVRKLEDIPRRIRLRLHCEFGEGGSALEALSRAELNHLRYLMSKADLLRQRAEEAKSQAQELINLATSGKAYDLLLISEEVNDEEGEATRYCFKYGGEVLSPSRDDNGKSERLSRAPSEAVSPNQLQRVTLQATLVAQLLRESATRDFERAETFDESLGDLLRLLDDQKEITGGEAEGRAQAIPRNPQHQRHFMKKASSLAAAVMARHPSEQEEEHPKQPLGAVGQTTCFSLLVRLSCL